MNRNAVGEEECSSIVESKSLAGGKHGAKTLRRVAIGLGTGNDGRFRLISVVNHGKSDDFTDEIDGKMESFESLNVATVSTWPLLPQSQPISSTSGV